VPEETAPPEAISGEGGGDGEMKERKCRDGELRIRALKARLTRQEAEKKARKAREEENRKRKWKLERKLSCELWESALHGSSPGVL
jgi:hypothetical protein